ncbi:unnamed protein product [Somion occarium]|uniref:THO complex subunit 1 n=1 Tax=Somion occarium TaxID=3059160 RepID=A0ABP1CGW3_9APHY
MQAIERSLKNLIASLPPQPIPKEVIDALVSEALSEVEGRKTTPENRRIQWEYALRNEVFILAEGAALKDPHTAYYDELRDILDIVLSFTEHDACEHIFPFNMLYDLLETQTIASCSHIFSWIEERADRLTEGMVPQKGKALVLLRTLNDLLRRLSKMGSTTKFCGRILTFLSRVFPLGERSGVNLRGEYGPAWEGPGVERWEKSEISKAEQAKEEDSDKMQVDEPKVEIDSATASKEEPKDDFYRVFWSLQSPFSRPPMFAEPHILPKFKEAVNRVLPVIKEATAKERALMGSKTVSGASLKRKRESEAIGDPNTQDYFFAKYLTSPELLDLEVADTHFRRQFLLQLLILLQHLLTFTKSAKAEWLSQRNRSLQIDFTLEPDDAQWVEDTIKRASEELRQTTPNGRLFAETIQVILEREKNWIKWKNELCYPFEREAWSSEVEVEDEQGRKVKRKIGLEEATADTRKKIREEPPAWEHRYGSAPLTEIWDMGYRDLYDLQHPFQAGDIKDFVKKVKQEEAKIEMRKKQLARAAERIAQARAKAAASAVQNQETAENPPRTVTPPPSASRTLPTPSTPLQHPLPAKPGTAASKPPPQDNAVATPTPTPAPAPAAPEPVHEPSYENDELILQYEENKMRWAWLALRTTRDLYLLHFAKIGTGDIMLLSQEIDKEVKETKEREEKASRGESTASANQDDRGTSPGMVVTASLNSVSAEAGKTSEDGQAAVASEQANGRDSEGDVKMEA